MASIFGSTQNLFNPSNFNNHGQGLSAIYAGGGKPVSIDEYADNEYASIFEGLICDLKILIENYSLAKIDLVEDALTGGFKDRIGVNLLEASSKTVGSDFREKFRSSLAKTFEGLQQSVLQYAKLQETIRKLEACEERASILDDPKKLQEYIDGLKRSKYLFDLPDIKAIAATLKPEYARYVELYGFPEGAIFDTDKLTIIKRELGLL